MNDVIEEWIAKAEGDYRTACRELAVEQDPNHDAVCFHAQQCVEKLMKALLISRQIHPGRTHNLLYLSQQIRQVQPNWNPPPADLRILTQAAVAFRYPGESAERTDAEETVMIAGRLREQLLKLLGRMVGSDE